MRPSHTDDSIDGFTLELLRAGYALTNLGWEVADAMAEDTACPDGGSAVFEMISGSIKSFLAEADPAQVQIATQLMSGAVDRVIEHMQLALELRRRMEGGESVGRGYDDPLLEEELTGADPQWPETDAAAVLADTPELPPGPTGELAEALVYCGGLLSQVIAQMVRWDGQTPEGEVPIPEAACNLVGALLGDLAGVSEEDLEVATRVVEALSESLTHDIYFVDPDHEDPDLN